MQQDEYLSPNSYWLIYAYEIPASSDHTGLIKVGGTSFKSPKTAEQLTPDCKELQSAAKARIDGQTGTASVKYNLLYVELAARLVKNGSSQYLAPFQDHQVHDVLEKSGFKHVKIAETRGREWYKLDVGIVKKAIKAVKENRKQLDSSELNPPPKFVFRAEQLAAIEKTLKRFNKHGDMLWDAKMRFGKTPTALEVVRRGKYRRTIIITHRPVVGTSWEEDYHKILGGDRAGYTFIDRSKLKEKDQGAAEEAKKKTELKHKDKSGKPFIYFASVQDLRGSIRVGGKFCKNDAVFDMTWDLVIIDEAHEGMQTDWGQKVKAALTTKNHTRVLSLSGTPYNILSDYDDDAVYVWDYTQEQATKEKWTEGHPGEPNPYAVLPKMKIYTFDLAAEMSEFAEEELEGKAFNFTEFFRTWTGNEELDGRKMPPGAKVGDFVHAADVEKFLDLISTPSTVSRYPFATPEYCDFFRHSLWMVPGVAAARALSEMLKKHKIFRDFGIANVAGEGDTYEEDHYDDALAEVRAKIQKFPRTITLSCGKLTTGVTVPEWTAVMMISGSVHTAASAYMQTIFRVQSPWVHDGQMKEECYVFDFAPDRTLTVLTETAQLSRKVSKDGAKEEAGRKALSEFINFCPVIAMDGGKARPYDVKEMMKRLKHVFIVKAIRNGFDDVSIYNNAKLLRLGCLDLMKFADLERIVGKTKQTEAPNTVPINELGFDKEEFEKKKKEKEQKLKRQLTPQELEALKKHREELQRARDARAILRAISIRMPLLIFGADVKVDEAISIRRFAQLVDPTSWAEFMPKGVTKERFRDFIEYYDPDVFEAAGLEIRRLAKVAEKLSPGKRVQQIARIFSYFKNPDKETVLTPWRVVNMHMSDTIGGWCFFPESTVGGDHRAPRGRANTPGSPLDGEPLDDPRFVDRGDVTRRVFSPTSRILEINSKSGLYPLYVAYSLYRARCGEIAEDDIAPIARDKKWREVLNENVFVICKTPMAASITRRTLAGFSSASVNARCWKGDLVETLKTNPAKFTKTITTGNFWKKENKEMKFDAVVGNPPYQQEVAKKVSETNGQAPRKSVFHLFQLAADQIAAGYVSLIYPGARWIHQSGKDMSEFGRKQINDPRLYRLDFYPDSTDVFSSVEITDGISIVSKDMTKTDNLFDYFYHKEELVTHVELKSPGDDLMPLNPSDGFVVKKIRAFAGEYGLAMLSERILPRSLFGIESDFVEKNPQKLKHYTKGQRIDPDREIKLLANDRAGSAGRASWYVGSKKLIKHGIEYISEWQVVVSSAHPGGQENRDWQMEIIDNNTAFGRSRVALGTFKTKVEAEHFYAYCKTYLVRFLFLMTDEALTSLAKAVPDFGDYTSANKLLDFSKDLNAQLYDIMGLTKAEQQHVEKTIKDIDASRYKK